MCSWCDVVRLRWAHPEKLQKHHWSPRGCDLDASQEMPTDLDQARMIVSVVQLIVALRVKILVVAVAQLLAGASVLV